MDSSFSRYAIYFIADPAEALYRRASAWLGWDCVNGRDIQHPGTAELDNTANIDIAAITVTPRKYGFHGTIKPPMRLAEGVSEALLRDRAAALADSTAPVTVKRMEVAQLGRFLAIVPSKPCRGLEDAAARFVTELDDLRAPLTASELERRRHAALTDRQDGLLQKWGYPYVLDEFRFHMTLSGPLDEADGRAAMTMLGAWLTPVIPAPMTVNRMALAGEGADGRFRVISWFPLGGQRQAS